MELRAKAAPFAAVYCRGRGVEAGLDRQLPYALCATDLTIFADESMDYVFSTRQEWAGLWRLLRPRGRLALALEPSDSALEDIRALGSARVLEDAELEGCRFQVFEKSDAWEYVPLRLGERDCLVIRGGAHGDALMASSVFPGLVEQGWRLSLLTHPSGAAAVQHDPHLDRILVSDMRGVPEGGLERFWSAWGQRFARVVNLTASVEGRFLQRTSDHGYWWPDDQRRRICGGSYLEFQHECAGVPGPYRVKFYPNPNEVAWVAKKLPKLGRFVFWSLNGSAQHKRYPHTPEAVVSVLERSDLNIVISGDENGRPLEHRVLDAVAARFGENTRVFSLIGDPEGKVYSVRQAYALAQYAEVVVGPETGVMNAVCMEPMRKVMLLSHGTRSNMTDDWVNAVGIEPAVGCYPCHRLHFNTDHCPQDEALKAAVCAASIPPRVVADAVLDGIQQRAVA